MTVITIGAVLLGLATSSFKYVTNANRVSTEVNALLGDLMLARSEAIKQGVNVVTCPKSTTAISCVSGGSTSWQGGWIVFADNDGNNSYGTGDLLLRVQNAFTAPGDTFQSSDSVQFIAYNREGFATGLPTNSSGYITITLHTSSTNNQWTRCLQVGTYGALATQHYDGAGCL
jgi:type IV fimbrial biogenesis protein FimT